MAKKTNNKNISLRLPESTLTALDIFASSKNVDRTKVIRDAISQYIGLPANSLEDRLLALENKTVAQEKAIAKLTEQIQQLKT